MPGRSGSVALSLPSNPALQLAQAGERRQFVLKKGPSTVPGRNIQPSTSTPFCSRIFLVLPRSPRLTATSKQRS